MSPFGRWLVYFWVYFTVICTIILSVNFMVDPFGNENRWVEQKYKPILDTDKRKYNYLFSQNRLNQYDGVIMGSSRVMQIHPSKNRHIANAYNFGIDSATLSQSSFVINEWIRVSGPNLKYVLLGIDFFAFDEKANRATMREVQERFSGRNNYAAYLLSFDTLELSIKALQSKFADNVLFYFQEDGGFVYAYRDSFVEKGLYDHSDLRMYSDALLLFLSYDSMKYSPKGMQHLRQIKAACERNGTRLIPFITPEQQMLLGFIGNSPVMREDFVRFRRDLAEVFDKYHDFSGANSVNKAGTNYYDAVHYRTNVGNMIANRVLEVPDPQIPQDFGAVVTKNNLEGHIRTLNRQMDETALLVRARMRER